VIPDPAPFATLLFPAIPLASGLSGAERRQHGWYCTRRNKKIDEQLSRCLRQRK